MRNKKKCVNYSYDALNRITAASGATTSNYNVSNISYDKNGNIQSLTRNGWQNSSNYINMDVLSYNYNSGNQLMGVADTGNTNYGFKDGNTNGDDYLYDSNGNLKIDKNKGITGITYNHLNLPIEVIFDNNQNKKIMYIYDASGIKIKKLVTDGSSLTTTEYAGNYIYENSQLQFFSTTEGYVSVENNNSYSYVYSCLDHLGNVRLSYTDANGDGQVDSSEIIEESNYYPFGLKQRGYNGNISSLGNSTAQKWKYNGKELQEEFGIGWYDYHARNYQADLGRWMNLDNHADSYFSWSPYNYAINDPVNVIDPDGNDIYILTWFSKTGESGHAGIAIDNYKTVNKKDAQGNDVLDANGNAVTEQVKDGTFTYYDLWPNDPVDPDKELQTNVAADYSNGILINSLDDLKKKDPTTQRSGNVSAEGRAADGIVQIGTNYQDDEAAKKAANTEINNNNKYNACYNNCSTFSQRIANIALGGSNQIDAKQRTTLSWIARKYTGYKNADIIAPNNLYNEALKVKGSKRIKGPKSVQAKPYLDYFPKGN